MDANWQHALDAFLDSIEDISGSTRSRMRYAYILHAFFTDEQRNPDSYTRAEVQNFVTAKSTSRRNLGREVSPSTRNNRLMALNSFYKFATNYERDGTLLFDGRPPTFGLKYVKTGSSPKGLSSDELKRFFATIPGDSIKGLRDRAIFLVFFWTGRRRSEIARLHWRDIEHAVLIESDGSRRAGVLYSYIAKGHSRDIQRAELPQPAWAAIERYLDQSARIRNMLPNDPLFTSTRTDQPNQALTGDYMNAEFKRYARLAGLDPRYSLHSLRHTAARLRYEAGSSIQDVQLFLGHSSIGTTDIYLKRLTGISDPGAKLLEQRFKDL